MTVEQAFMMDRFRQMQVENERLKDETNGLKNRLGNATQDYVRLLVGEVQRRCSPRACFYHYLIVLTFTG